MSSQFYEKVVKEKNTVRNVFKKITVIMCYALIFFIFLFTAINCLLSEVQATKNYFLLVIALGILIEVITIGITWKYLQKEYEYSFEYGRMSIAKIYGKRKRKLAFETDMSTMLIIAPATDEYIAKAEHFDIDKKVIAVSDLKSDDIWLVVSGGDDERRVLAFFEADDRALSILRAANPLSFIRKK